MLSGHRELHSKNTTITPTIKGRHIGSPLQRRGIFICFFCAHILCVLFFCLILFWANTSVRPYNNKNHCKSNSSLKAKWLRGAPQRVRRAMLGKVGDMFERSESLNGPSTCDIRRATRHEATEECRK